LSEDSCSAKKGEEAAIFVEEAVSLTEQEIDTKRNEYDDNRRSKQAKRLEARLEKI